MIRLAWIVPALALAGCASTPPAGDRGPPVAELSAVPFFPQQRYQCGPAALATVLAASGVSITPDELTPQVYVPARHGSLQAEMLAAARRNGRVAVPLRGGRAALEAELRAGHPVLVLQNFGSRGHPLWHYAVVIGIEPGHVLLRSGTTARERSSDWRFAATWRRADEWGFVALAPGELPASGDARDFLDAAAAFEHLATPADAAATYAAAAARWPQEPAAWFGLGNARARAGDAAAAEAAYRRALAVAPRYVAARNNLADLLARRGCLAAARREAARAVADAADSPLRAAVEATSQDLNARPAAPPAADCPPPTP